MANPWPYNYHCHTRYGDGHSHASDLAAEAHRRGMLALGVSEHAPLGDDIDWTMAADRVERYRNELVGLRHHYEGELEIYYGLEVDWWPSRGEWWNRIDRSHWDYLIGSVHHVTSDTGDWIVDNTPPIFEQGVQQAFNGDIRLACEAFFDQEKAAALSGRFDVLGHFDLVKKFNKNGRYFDSSESWYRELAKGVVRAAAESGVITEVNTAGLDKPVNEFYPAPWLVEECVEHGVRLTLSSDAHSEGELQRHFQNVLTDLRRCGVRELWELTGGEWKPIPLSSASL